MISGMGTTEAEDGETEEEAAEEEGILREVAAEVTKETANNTTSLKTVQEANGKAITIEKDAKTMEAVLEVVAEVAMHRVMAEVFRVTTSELALSIHI